MFCAKCGHQIPENGQFCTYCGTKVNAYIEDNPAPVKIPQPAPKPAPVYTPPTPISPATSQKTAVQTKQSWTETFLTQWRNMLPQSLLLAFAIGATIMLILRVVLFKDFGEESVFSSDIASLLSGWGLDEIKEIRNVLNAGKFLSFVLNVFPFANFAYCVLLGIGIWRAYNDSRSGSLRSVDIGCYNMMIWAQYIIIGIYALGAISMLIFRMNVGSFLNEFKTDYLSEYLIKTIEDKIYDPVDLYTFFCFACGAYHVVATILLKRVISAVDNMIPYGLQFSMVFAVISFIIGGLFATVYIWIIAAYYILEGILLIKVNNEAKMLRYQYHKYKEENNKENQQLSAWTMAHR